MRPDPGMTKKDGYEYYLVPVSRQASSCRLLVHDPRYCLGSPRELAFQRVHALLRMGERNEILAGGSALGCGNAHFTVAGFDRSRLGLAVTAERPGQHGRA